MADVHLTKLKLIDYSCGRLSSQENETVEQHLENCPACQELFDQVSRVDCTRSLPLPREETPVKDWIGEHGNGTYRLVRLLGSGGMADVWEAYKSSDDAKTRFALKIIRPETRSDLLHRELRNLELLKPIEHSSIVVVYAVEVQHRCISMELLKGLTLRERIERCGRIESPLELLRIAEDIVDALSTLHPIIQHKDIKLSNIALARRQGAQERAIIFDFGISTTDEMDITVGGTPGNRDPDVEGIARNRVERRRSEDFYSVGKVIYEMLNGIDPHFEKGDLLREPKSGTRYREIAELVPWLCGNERPHEAGPVLKKLESLQKSMSRQILPIAKNALNTCREVTFQWMKQEQSRSFAITRDNLRTHRFEQARLLDDLEVGAQEIAELCQGIGHLLFVLTVGDPPDKGSFGEFARKRGVDLPSEFLRLVESLTAKNRDLRPQSLAELDDGLYRLLRQLEDSNQYTRKS